MLWLALRNTSRCLVFSSRFGVSAEKQGAWVLKTFDYFEVCKACFNSSCSLNKILSANGKEQKTGDGKMAVQWAKEERWDKVEEYCMQAGYVSKTTRCGAVWQASLVKALR